MAQFISNVRVKFHKTYVSKLPQKRILIDQVDFDYRDHHVHVCVYRTLKPPVKFYYSVSGYTEMYLWADEYSKLMLQYLMSIVYAQIDSIYAVFQPSDTGDNK